jgi:hypothetical protein
MILRKRPLRYRLRNAGLAPAGTISTGAHLPQKAFARYPAPAGSVFVDDPTVSSNAAYNINQPLPQTSAPWYQSPWLWVAAGIGAVMLGASGGRRRS